MNIKYTRTIITSLALSMGAFALTACNSTDSDSGSSSALGGKSSTNASKGKKEASAEAVKVAQDYKKVVLNFIKAKQYSLLALGSNAEANKYKSEIDKLENNTSPTLDDVISALDAAGGSIDMNGKKLSSDEAKEYFTKSVGYLSAAVAQETLLVNTVSEIAKNAQTKIASASFMEKPKLISSFTPIIDLASRLPEDLKITTVTLADYITYALDSDISQKQLDEVKKELLNQ